MKKRFVLLEDASTPSSFTNDRSSWSSMIDYSGSAPGGLLFAIYFSPGGGAGLFSSCSSQGLVTSPCAIRGALESGVFSFSGNIGLEICWLEQAFPRIAMESGKLHMKTLLIRHSDTTCSLIWFNEHSQDGRIRSASWSRRSTVLQALLNAQKRHNVWNTRLPVPCTVWNGRRRLWENGGGMYVLTSDVNTNARPVGSFPPIDP